MAATQKDPVLVTVQLSGGNDYLNTVIPFNDPLYRDNRPAVGIPDDQILKVDKNYGFNPAMAPLKKVWDQGKLAIVHGVGYASRRRWEPRAGWVRWRANTTPKKRTWSRS